MLICVLCVVVRTWVVRTQGRNLRIKFFVSPYRRANQTLAHILRSFPDRSKYRIRTDPRLREQEFGKLRDFHHLTVRRASFGSVLWCFHHALTVVQHWLAPEQRVARKSTLWAFLLEV